MRDAEPTERVAEVHAHPRSSRGAPRMHAQLRQDGEQRARRRVTRLMRDLGPADGIGGAAADHHPDLGTGTPPDLTGRDFTPDAAELDARCCGDITYTTTEEGWFHLATVIDMASRRVVEWSSGRGD